MSVTKDSIVAAIAVARLASFCRWMEKTIFPWKKTAPAKIVFAGKNWFLPLVGKITIKSYFCNYKTSQKYRSRN